MNLYGRFLLLLLKRLFYFKKIDGLQPCTTEFLVNPLDLDINFHMNNGRYLSIMDLGRLDLMLKAKVFWPLLFDGYYPLVVTECIRFKKSLQPFQRFELVTRMETWDEKNFYMRQTFERKGEVLAVGYIKARFKKRGQSSSIPTAEILKQIGIENFSEPAQSTIEVINKMESTLFNGDRKETPTA